MTIKNLFIKLFVKPDQNSLNSAQQKIKKVVDIANETHNLKIGLMGMNVAFSEVARLRSELRKLKENNINISATTIGGKKFYLNRYGNVSRDLNEIKYMTSIANDEAKRKQTSRDIQGNINKTTKLGTIFSGALMTIGYQFVGMIENGAKKVIETSNKTLKIQSQMATLTKNKEDQKAFEADMYKIANQSFSDVNDVADLYTKIGLNAKHLGYSGGDVSKMTQSVFDIFSYSSVGKQQQQGAITQLTQTIAKGKNKALWMDIKFLEEDAPELANMIAEGLGIKEGLAGLKQAVQDGKVTGKQIGDALVKMSDKARKKFLESNKVRPEQAITYLNNKFKEAVAKHSETISKIAKGMITITDKVFSEGGAFETVINGVGNFIDKMNIDAWANKLAQALDLLKNILSVLGDIFTIIWYIVNYPLVAILTKLGISYLLVDKLTKKIMGLRAIALALGLLTSSVFWWVSAILGVILLIQDAWKTFTDPNSDTLFRNIYNWVKGIADALHIKVAEWSGNSSDKLNEISESSVLGRINSFLPESIRNANNGLTFMINQTFNGKVDNETAENYKQASKDMADMTENRYSEYYMANYRG